MVDTKETLKMQTKITPKAIDELFKKIEATSYPPQSDHIFFALQNWVFYTAFTQIGDKNEL